jgi:hypothetical protein
MLRSPGYWSGRWFSVPGMGVTVTGWRIIVNLHLDFTRLFHVKRISPCAGSEI